MLGTLSSSFRHLVAAARAPLVREVCPFCFEYLKISTTPFRCVNVPANCGFERDPVLETKWGDGTPVGKVTQSPGRFVKSVLCSHCGHKTTKRLCPHCHQTLPYTFGEFRNYIFSVIGAKAAGKSHFLPVLIEQFKHHIGPSLGMSLQEANDDTISRFRNSFYNYIYKDRKVIPANVSGQVNPDVQMPLLFNLIITGSGITGKRKITKAITLAFFDTAGEDLKQRDVLERVCKYIYRSDGIILLVDPLQFDRVRDRLRSDTELPERETETNEIVSRVADLIRSGREIPLNRMIDIPLAVALTKLDEVEHLLDPQMRLLATSNLDGGFSESDFNAIDGEVQTLLQNWETRGIEHQVTSNFSNAGFFALTALGCSPDEAKNIPRVLPRRIEDPFLWLLSRHGMLKSA